MINGRYQRHKRGNAYEAIGMHHDDIARAVADIVEKSIGSAVQNLKISIWISESEMKIWTGLWIFYVHKPVFLFIDQWDSEYFFR